MPDYNGENGELKVNIKRINKKAFFMFCMEDVREGSIYLLHVNAWYKK